MSHLRQSGQHNATETVSNDVEIDDVAPCYDPDEIDREALDQIWPEIMPIIPEHLPSFPVDALPRHLADWVRDMCVAYQVVPDLPALCGLAVASAAITRRLYAVASTGHIEPSNLYCAVVLPPGSRKSAVFKEAYRPFGQIEKSVCDTEKPELAKKLAEWKTKKSELAEAEKQVGKVKDADRRRELRDTINSLQSYFIGKTEPSERMMMVVDSTNEKLATLIANNDQRLALMSAEGELFGIMGGKFQQNRVPDFDLYLHGHDGGDHRCARQSRDTVLLENFLLSICVTIQPEVLLSLPNSSAMTGRGLLARFMFAVPSSNLGRRDVRAQRAPDPTIRRQYEDLIKSLHHQTQQFVDDPLHLKLTKEAMEEYYRYAEEVETRLRDQYADRAFTWRTKSVGLSLRIACILHALETVASKREWTKKYGSVIRRETYRRAVMIVEWASAHAHAAMCSINVTSSDVPMHGVGACLKMIERVRFDEGRQELTRREIQQRYRRAFASPDELDQSLELLCQHGFLHRHRSRKSHYLISPKLTRVQCQH